MNIENYIVRFDKSDRSTFSYWFAHGTIGSGLLDGIDYTCSLTEESSFAEAAFIVFMNNLEYDETGVTNYKEAEFRAAQYVRYYHAQALEHSPDLAHYLFEFFHC